MTAHTVLLVNEAWFQPPEEPVDILATADHSHVVLAVAGGDAFVSLSHADWYALVAYVGAKLGIHAAALAAPLAEQDLDGVAPEQKPDPARTSAPDDAAGQAWKRRLSGDTGNIPLSESSGMANRRDPSQTGGVTDGKHTVNRPS